MASNPPVALPSPYPSRRGWLIAFGIMEILIGCGFVLMILLTAVALLGPARPRTMPNGFHPAVALAFVAAEYALLAAVFVIAGIGSIRCRNWARILMLVVSGLWLAVGILTTIVMALVVPAVMRQQGHHLPAGSEHMILVVMLIVFAGFMVLLPIIFLVFYSLKSVRATCRESHPVPQEGALAEASAAPRTPVPVLILGVWESITALCVVACLFFRVTVFFGLVVEGLPAVMYFLAYSVFSGLAALLIFRRKLLGWQIAIAKTGLMAASALVTLLHPPDWVQLYRKMGVDSQVLRIYDQFPQFMPAIWAFTLVVMGGLLYFIYYTRRYFPNE
jgi:hypothetical protein